MSNWNTANDIPDLNGRVAVVTGASSGVGLQIVQQLAQHGAKVYATTRSAISARKAQEAFSGYPDIPSMAVEWLYMDLLDLRSITSTAEELRRKADRLDILISNAATITTSKENVSCGWEKNMAVNVIGSLLFVNRVTPLLKSTSRMPGSDVRIVTIASTAPQAFLPTNFQFRFNSADGLASPVLRCPAVWQYITRFLFTSDMIHYSVSKAGSMIYASKLQQIFDSRGLSILSLVVHPGEVATEGVAEANGVFIRAIARMTFLTSQQGAASPLFAGTAELIRTDPDGYKYKLLLPVGKPADLHPVVNDMRQSEGLWEHVNGELAQVLEREGLAPLEKW